MHEEICKVLRIESPKYCCDGAEREAEVTEWLSSKVQSPFVFSYCLELSFLARADAAMDKTDMVPLTTFSIPLSNITRLA
jgi:hypothetical protein